jgi:hypothetical protein
MRSSEKFKIISFNYILLKLLINDCKIYSCLRFIIERILREIK